MLQILPLMKIKHFFCLLTLLPLLTFGQFENKKNYTISECRIPPKIDGVLDDIHWSELAKADNFKQMNPNNGANERIGQKTEVQICYDNNAKSDTLLLQLIIPQRIYN